MTPLCVAPLSVEMLAMLAMLHMVVASDDMFLLQLELLKGVLLFAEAIG